MSLAEQRKDLLQEQRRIALRRAVDTAFTGNPHIPVRHDYIRQAHAAAVDLIDQRLHELAGTQTREQLWRMEATRNPLITALDIEEKVESTPETVDYGAQAQRLHSAAVNAFYLGQEQHAAYNFMSRVNIVDGNHILRSMYNILTLPASLRARKEFNALNSEDQERVRANAAVYEATPDATKYARKVQLASKKAMLKIAKIDAQEANIVHKTIQNTVEAMHTLDYYVTHAEIEAARFAWKHGVKPLGKGILSVGKFAVKAGLFIYETIGIIPNAVDKAYAYLVENNKVMQIADRIRREVYDGPTEFLRDLLEERYATPGHQQIIKPNGEVQFIDPHDVLAAANKQLQSPEESDPRGVIRLFAGQHRLRPDSGITIIPGKRNRAA